MAIGTQAGRDNRNHIHQTSIQPPIMRGRKKHSRSSTYVVKSSRVVRLVSEKSRSRLAFTNRTEATTKYTLSERLNRMRLAATIASKNNTKPSKRESPHTRMRANHSSRTSARIEPASPSSGAAWIPPSPGKSSHEGDQTRKVRTCCHSCPVGTPLNGA